MASDLKMELRWLVEGDARVLQYRQQHLQTQYSMYNEKAGDFWKLPEWGPWINVPEFSPVYVSTAQEANAFSYNDVDDDISEGIEGENE